MPRDLDLDPTPRSEACRAILDHWLAVRESRLRPKRSEIDPTSLARYLPHIGVFEVRGPTETICRLAGTAFHRSLGFELAGRNAVHLYEPGLHRAAGHRFVMMALQPCGALFDLPLQFESGPENPHEILLLPLEPDKADAPVALLVGIAPVHTVIWQNTAVLPQLGASPTFRFIDIGAGIPVSSLPPEEFSEPKAQ